MSYAIRYTPAALEDFERLYDHLVLFDIALADRALRAIQQAIMLLESFPFSCRKASSESPFVRELLVPFGSSGCVVLFRIDENKIVTVAAVRHHREDDYH